MILWLEIDSPDVNWTIVVRAAIDKEICHEELKNANINSKYENYTWQVLGFLKLSLSREIYLVVLVNLKCKMQTL